MKNKGNNKRQSDKGKRQPGFQPKAYRGELEVTPNDFSLSAEHFILREESVSLVLTGSAEGDGSFRVEGALEQNGSGGFVGKLPCRYPGWSQTDVAKLIIFRAIATDDSCDVSGRWEQDGDAWVFAGLLEPFHPGT